MQETHLTFKSPFGELSKALLTSLFVAIVGTGIVAIFSATDLSTSLDGNMANSFLATVAQITAAIVAIVFTISTLTISVVSDRYSSQLMSKFIYDPITITTFFIQLFLCCPSHDRYRRKHSYVSNRFFRNGVALYFQSCNASVLFSA